MLSRLDWPSDGIAKSVVLQQPISEDMIDRGTLSHVFQSSLTLSWSKVRRLLPGVLRSVLTPKTRTYCSINPGLCGSSGSSVQTPETQSGLAFVASQMETGVYASCQFSVAVRPETGWRADPEGTRWTRK